MYSETYPQQYEVTPGMSIEWLEAGRIVVYRMGRTDTEAVNKLYQAVLEIMDRWPVDKPYLAIYEVADTHVMFTGHIRRLLSHLTDHRPELKGRAAGVLDAGPTAHAIRLFMMMLAKKGGRAKKYFTHRTAAITWLKEAQK